jgi:hypothetical protein
MERRRSDSSAPGRMWALKGVGKSSIVKCVLDAETQKYVEASAKAIESVIRLPRKSSKLIFNCFLLVSHSLYRKAKLALGFPFVSYSSIEVLLHELLIDTSLTLEE